MNWLVSYFYKGYDDNRIELRRFFDKSEDFVDGYIEKLGEDKKKKGTLIVTKEKI